MESIAELKDICRRDNDRDNRRTMMLAARVSIYFTRLFLMMRMSANQVTCLFTALGLAGALAFLGPGLYWAVAGYLLFRLHVIVDVSDGEVARYRKTFSPIGAYLDFITHYLVYNIICFSIPFRYWMDSGWALALASGGVLMIGVTLNRAGVDCWFRANFGNLERDQIEEGRQGQKRSNLPGAVKNLVLSIGHITSIQSFLNVYILALIVERIFKMDIRLYLIPAYAIVLLSFSLGRIGYTIYRGKIPRRANYY